MKTIFISTGEPSGDHHAAHLIKEALQRNPNIQFKGMCGAKMRAAGCETIVNNENLAVIGAIEILAHAKDIINAMITMRKALKEQKPDLLILIDYSGFHLRLAKYAKKLGIKILYYISPTVWAWRKHRIKTIQKCVDHMAVILPFEENFYQQHQVKATYVGNSLIETVKPSMTKEECYEKFQLDKNNLIVGLVPGSRRGEIKRIFPTILESAKKLNQKYKNMQFVIPLAPSRKEEELQEYLTQYQDLNIKIIPHDLYNVMQICQAAIVVSGTVTLEIALLGIPMTIIYRIAPSSFIIGKLLINTKHIGLCNLIADKRIVPELIQHQANPDDICLEISRMIDDDLYVKEIKNDFEKLRNILSLKEDCPRIYDVVLDMINQ